MGKIIDLTGKIFGRLKVIKFFGKDKQNHAIWTCKCVCGNTRMILSNSLKSGKTKSCGCLSSEIASKNMTKHGLSCIKTYHIWKGIKNRCNNPNNPSYYNYGGRGIKVCERWMKFENFFEDMGEPPTNRHSIDRINNNKGYSKSNCRWTTKDKQVRNTRHNYNIKYKGKTKCLKDWANELNIPYVTIWYRLRKFNWTVKRAFVK